MSLSRATLLNATIFGLACASAVLVVATRGAVTTTDSAGREQNLLAVFRSEDVTLLEMTHGDQQMTLERVPALDGGAAAFNLTTPVKERADAAIVEKFLLGLAGAKALRAVDSGVPRGSLGLDAPSTRIVVHEAKVTYDLTLGGSAPAPEGARYLQLKSNDGSSKLLLVAKSVAEDLAVDLDAFRLRSIVSVSESDVTQITIKSPTLDISLLRGPGKSFVVDGAPKQRADRETVTSLFFQLSRLTAGHFLTAAQAESALGPERAHFQLKTSDLKGSVSFDVGGVCPSDSSQLVLARQTPEPQSACISREITASLDLKRDAFLDRHAFSLRTDEVEEFEISGGDAKLRLVRQGTGFVLHVKADSEVALDPGNQRITEVLDAQGELIPGPKLAELGLDPARSKVTVRSSAAREADVQEQVVRVGNKDQAGDLFVYREQDGVALRIPREQARGFSPDSTLLYAKKLVEFGQSSFISAEITRGGEHQVLRRGANQSLQLETPKGFDLDGSLAADVIQALGALDAERFVSDADDGSFGLQNAVLVVDFTFKTEHDPKVSHTLRFGNETALGVFASLDSGGPVFVLSRAVRDTLDLLLINRSVAGTEPGALSGFGLEARGRTLRFERHGEQFAAVPTTSFSQDRIPALLEALGDLRPEAALHTGPAKPAEGLATPSLTLRLSPKLGPAQIVTFGAGDSWRSSSVFYARVSGIDATYVIAQSKVRALSDAF